jgi:hypothetical protein
MKTFTTKERAETNRRVLNAQPYRLSIHFKASTSLIFPKHISFVDKFEWRNMIFEMISVGTPELCLKN